MPTRNVVLGEHQQQLVERLVQSGRYQNASELMREGLRLVAQRERIETAKREALKQAARQGWADVAAGRYVEIADDRLEDFIGQWGCRAPGRGKGPWGQQLSVALSGLQSPDPYASESRRLRNGGWKVKI